VLRMATDQGLWEAPLYHRTFLAVPQPMALNLGSGDLTANPRKEVQFDSYSIVRQDEHTKWHWTFSPQPQYVSDANIRNPRVIFGNAGSYDVTLTVTTPSGTSSRTIRNMITINSSTGIDESHVGEVGLMKNILEQGENLVVTTTGLDSDSRLTIHDLKGRLMHSAHVPVSQPQQNVPLNHLSSGMYIYQITNARQKFFGQFSIR
ncbi:MAG: PKD domain-containing protein, partial [Bacteroidaceae bacterium]|nr:PKD domain-containing protein [Bacteroidaceae bacterium]